LLKDDQDRITTQERAAKYELDVAESDLDGWQDVLRTAIKLAGNCHAAYLKARPSVRRRFNQAVLEAVYVKDRRIARAEFYDVFAPLFSSPNRALKVVDIGCGTGLTTREAARAAPARDARGALQRRARRGPRFAFLVDHGPATPVIIRR
jgi:2-polyprenyl-3-methyl-5-hydroxy-6-metoxy-1,4-benzoquinol methylase